MQTVYAALVWSLTELATGRFPANDHLGRPFPERYDKARWLMAGKELAGGMVGCWAEMRGDWKYLKEALHLKSHYNMPNAICHLCRVSKFSDVPAMRFTNFRKDAPHRDSVFSAVDWKLLYLAFVVVSQLLLIPGFCIRRVFFDVMHCLDLGVYQVAVPSVMKELVQLPGVFVGGSIQARYSQAYREYRGWCRRRRVKSVIGKKFRQKVWYGTATTFPKISQLTAKAAALRSMTYWVSNICRRR